MTSLELYESNPFDLFDRLLSNDSLTTDGGRAPSVDVREEKDRYVLEAELPGLSEKDITLEIKDDVLSLSTVRKGETVGTDEKVRYIRKERRDFRFSRSFELPEDADRDKIEARFRDGLLTVELPRKPETAPRIVPVKVA